MGGKERSSSSSLGRALVRQHNHMVQQSKDKGAALHKLQRKQHQIGLESYTEVTDLEAILEQAEEASRVHSMANPTPALRIDADWGAEGKRERRKQEEALYASSLRVPRRPSWNAKMSVEELDANEKQAFLAWRRSLARIEENENLVLTPFEKNLDIWRQLWRVLERSDLLVMVVDARNPLFYRCPDLEAYALEIDEHKETLLLVNKADLLPLSVRKQWANYFQNHGILFVFWSAKAASAAQEGKQLRSPWKDSVTLDEDAKIYKRDELLARLQAEAEAIVARKDSDKNGRKDGSHDMDMVKGTPKQVVVGFVGYPNVGKSSTINALVGEKRTGVTSTPGKTKHFQTLIISDKLVLCDCPGLVFPSFSSSRYEMIASGVLPIDRMTEHREAVQVVANHVPRHVLESVYNIILPKPKPYEPQSQPPLASELLRTFCSSRGYVASSGLPDETKSARLILKDYIDGKIPHFEIPPVVPGATCEGMELNSLDGSPSINCLNGYQSDSCGSDNVDPSNEENDAEKPNIDRLLNDLGSFDMDSGLSSPAVVKKKSTAATHKHHKKPQRKKDRSWRVGNNGGDGMPVVRVFQKPAVTLGSSKSVT